MDADQTETRATLLSNAKKINKNTIKIDDLALAAARRDKITRIEVSRLKTDLNAVRTVANRNIPPDLAQGLPTTPETRMEIVEEVFSKHENQEEPVSIGILKEIFTEIIPKI